ncbi:MAG TPA: GGDEF domain-containing protein [candidate division Zixibacteria bacterium]|jgi:diguanylate cyclase (GGDEF)-like protein|nr:GGDEF domain-containing protein [candidate division Zixibacteria bacterium]
MKNQKSSFTKEMIAILGKDYGESTEIMSQVEDLLKEKAHSLYSDLIYTLTHLHFSEAQARQHWEKILKHKQQMGQKLGRNVGVRVALMDYFTNLHHKIENPKIIELDVFEKTLLSAITDGLTGLYNHRYFQDRLEEELERSQRYGQPTALMLIDLDDFKRYNDANGHIAGDVLLADISKILRKTVRKVDVVARYGGEEFAVILPATKKKGALIIANRLCQKTAASRFPNQEIMPRKAMTVSIGLAVYPDDAKDKAKLIDMADKALYHAKKAGKNQVYHYGDA